MKKSFWIVLFVSLFIISCENASLRDKWEDKTYGCVINNDGSGYTRFLTINGRSFMKAKFTPDNNHLLVYDSNYSIFDFFGHAVTIPSDYPEFEKISPSCVYVVKCYSNQVRLNDLSGIMIREAFSETDEVFDWAKMSVDDQWVFARSVHASEPILQSLFVKNLTTNQMMSVSIKGYIYDFIFDSENTFYFVQKDTLSNQVRLKSHNCETHLTEILDEAVDDSTKIVLSEDKNFLYYQKTKNQLISYNLRTGEKKNIYSLYCDFVPRFFIDPNGQFLYILNQYKLHKIYIPNKTVLKLHPEKFFLDYYLSPDGQRLYLKQFVNFEHREQTIE